jgi:CrcB protein
MSSPVLWLAVALLGGLGSLSRFLLDAILTRGGELRSPAGTLAVNISGSVLLGVLLGAGVHGDAYLLIGTATIGSYTTFSTWMFESQQLAVEGRTRVLVANIVLSVALGLGAVEMGRLLGSI